LETTLFNYYFDKDRDAHVDTVRLFEDVAEGKYEAYTSIYVVRELENAENEKCGKMLALIDRYDITVLGLDPEAEQLLDKKQITGQWKNIAKDYVDESNEIIVLAEEISATGIKNLDALHLAVAIISGCNYL
jgi:predicted nucleic acid-binding protein